MKEKQLQVIGRNALIDIPGHAVKVPAKVDTGADRSSIWASDIDISRDGVLSFKLFGAGSPFYSGEVITRTAFTVAVVRSSNGEEQIRYRVELPIVIAGKQVRAHFYLADRSRNDLPILLGRRTLNKKFVVDVSVVEYKHPPRIGRGLRKEFNKDPYAFHQKYHLKNNNGNN